MLLSFSFSHLCCLIYYDCRWEGKVGLGSGWRTLLEVLKRGAGDSSAPVVSRTMAALALPVGALFAQEEGSEAASHG